MFNQNIPAYHVTAAITTAGLLGAGYAFYRYQKSKLPREWTYVGTLDSLYIYPIKSCAPVKVENASCTYLGLKEGWLRDRVLMVVDEKNNFINARVYPELLLVKPTVKNSILTLRHVDMEPLYVNLAEVIEVEKPFNATVWGCDVPVLNCGKEATEWFSKLLNRADVNYRLVYYSAQKCRKIKDITNLKFYRFGPTDTGALPDEASFNLINNASIEDLNGRLGEKGVEVSHRYFRPNFLIEGAEPYDEDKWKYVKIGHNVIFEVLKPCTSLKLWKEGKGIEEYTYFDVTTSNKSRNDSCTHEKVTLCVMTTIDPETGIRNPKVEPLEMLKSYRQFEDPLERKMAGNSPRMGLQMTLRSEPGGTVSCGNDVFVSYK